MTNKTNDDGEKAYMRWREENEDDTEESEKAFKDGWLAALEYERKKKAYLESQVDEVTAKRTQDKIDIPIVKKLKIDDVLHIFKENTDKLRRTTHHKLDPISASALILSIYPNATEYTIVKAGRLLSMDKAFIDKLQLV
jgi:hypothetical protein